MSASGTASPKCPLVQDTDDHIMSLSIL